MRSAFQFSLPLPPLPVSYAPDDFLIGAAHVEAVQLAESLDVLPGAGLFVVGTAGSGKSHFLRWLSGRHSVPVLNASNLDALADEPIPRLLLVDDAAADAPGAALFHALNRANAARAKVVLTAGTPLSNWTAALPDLVSRLKALTAVQLGAPDDATLAALYVKGFSERQMAITPRFIHYLCRHGERSFSAAQRLVTALDDYAYREQKPLTVPLARQFFRETAL
ncbi:MAG: DNA replication protein [Thalassospira sp.]|jgi:chromosomal replication initiation ATPase DnaA|nr:DNA replication protein [Thalassospira sp.]